MFYTLLHMDHFIKPVDELSRLIETQAQVLYHKMSDLPVKELGMSPETLRYYIKSHDNRKFFSVQTAAELLYRSISHIKKSVVELVIMDYGGGVGSLFLLAKMIGCKTVIYNDILPEATAAAQIMSNYLNIPIDFFITGDHKETIRILKENNIHCDIMLSRNVVEHIYSLDNFFYELSNGMPETLVYFSTTANYHNPAMLWYHKKIHGRAEEQYRPKREQLIREKIPGLSNEETQRLALATRGLAAHDLEAAIEKYAESKTLPDPDIHYTNTCDPDSGVWAEHIIPVADYKRIIEPKGYKLAVLPAFWDTHYSSAIKNIFGKSMNFLSKMLGPKGGLKTTAFIYIIAEKR